MWESVAIQRDKNIRSMMNVFPSTPLDHHSILLESVPAASMTRSMTYEKEIQRHKEVNLQGVKHVKRAACKYNVPLSPMRFNMVS